MASYPKSAYLLMIPPTQQDLSLGAEAVFYLVGSPNRQWKIGPNRDWFIALQDEPRTTLQLAGVPTPQDIAQADYVDFFDSSNRALKYRVKSDNTGYVQYGGGGGGGGGGSSTYTGLSDATSVDLPTVNTPLHTALQTLQAAISGTVKSINSLAPDGSGNLVLAANDIGAIPDMIGWNLDTNVATPAAPGTTFTPASGTFPSGGYKLLKAAGTTPRTLDGAVYGDGDFAEFSPALGIWVRISGNGNGVTRPASNYTQAATLTGSTTESTAQMSLTLATGTLVAGQRFEVDLYSTFSSDNATSTVKHYVNGAVALSGVAFTTATFFTAAVSHVTLIVIDATHVFIRINFDTSATARLVGDAILTVTSGAGLSMYFTYTNSTTGKTATPVLADARAFQP